jgi:hypothetical protein
LSSAPLKICVASAPLWIEVRRHQHPFVFQTRVAAFEQCHDVSIGHDVAIDGDAQVDARAGERERRDAARRLGRSRQLLERLPGAGDERRRQRREICATGMRIRSVHVASV